ncbi:hypothetical protein D3C76_1347430 [compost metagenome]
MDHGNLVIQDSKKVVLQIAPVGMTVAFLLSTLGIYYEFWSITPPEMNSYITEIHII